MGFRDFLAKVRERKQRLKDYEENDRIVNGVEIKKLSHNERELSKILEKERQQSIREALFWEEKRRQCDERIKARQMMTGNIFKKHNDDFLFGGGF